MTHPDTLLPTPLSPLYAEGVAEWMDVYGFAVPVTWGDPMAEYRAIREDVAVIEFSMLLKYDVTGPGAVDCVNRVFSRDVTRMKPGRIAYGVVVNGQGGMLDDCTVFLHGPGRVMVMGANPALGESLASAAPAGVTIRECRDDLAQISVQGPRSRQLLQSLTDADLSAAALPYYAFRADVPVAGHAMQVGRLGFTGELGFELLLPRPHVPSLWQGMVRNGRPHGLRPVGGAALMMARMEAGLIMGGLDYDESHSPWECRMGWAVDLGKPGFQGREALEKSRNHARTGIVSLVFPEGAEGLDGADLMLDQRPVGKISIAVPSPALAGRTLAFARVEIAASAPGTTLRAGRHTGTIVETPVYDPAKSRVRMA